MAQRTQLVDTLKASLKAHGKTYADVATHPQLSGTSIKRLFSDRNVSLQRLDDICKMINMEISDLVQLMNEGHAVHLSELTDEQEGEIASDIALLLVTVCVLNRWTLNEIVDYFHLSGTRCIRYLAKEFDHLNSDDSGLPFEERNGITVVLAMRRWSYGLFDDIRKKSGGKYLDVKQSLLVCHGIDTGL